MGRVDAAGTPGAFRLANEAWDAYSRAQATVARELADADIWDGLLTREYAVLHALSGAPDGLRMTDLRADALLTQPGMSRLIARLESRGLVERSSDSEDARARRIRLTAHGAETQRRVGTAVARRVATAMTDALDARELQTMRELSVKLLASRSEPRDAP
jgi:DNA-binding MarR family transcriptional regulator